MRFSLGLSLWTLVYGAMLPAALAQTVGLTGVSPGSASVTPPASALCGNLATSPLATKAAARRVQLLELESARSRCIGHAPFLAALGALWLEEGEPNQALIWLERSLLLDPENLGAQVDHALALAALGQSDALRMLVQSWDGRVDVPTALRQRLTVAAPSLIALGNATMAPGGVGLPRGQGQTIGQTNGQVNGLLSGLWVHYREATVLLGYESNLDHSPKLAEITLTVPDGPIDLLLLNPISPRPGAAITAELSWQLARSPEAGRIWRTGLNLATRAAPGESRTDWYNLQWAGSGSQQWGPWRGQLEASAAWTGGPLSEPYRLLRAGATLERSAQGCKLKLALDVERRTQQSTSSLDGRTSAALLSSQCPLFTNSGWLWGAAVRSGLDKAPDSSRAGGDQRFTSVGGRVFGTLPGGVRMEASFRINRVLDADGYSPLLENDARRQLTQSQVSLELAKPLPWLFGSGAEALWQVQAVRQSSNLSIFRYSAMSTYGGLRWFW